MIYETYCSYEVAVLLKEKGFDIGCYGRYSIRSKEFHFDATRKCENHGLFIIAAPTHQMAMKWLREVHKLYINIWADPKDVENDDFDIIFRAQVYDGASNYGIHEFSTYEEACEALLKFTLENLI